MNISKSVILSLVIGILAFAASLYWSQDYWLDLNPPLCSARKLISGQEPYQGCATDYGGRPAAQYPMTTILAFVPFALLPGIYASATIWAAIHMLLAYGIVRSRKPWLFLVFASGPYALAFIFHQFSPLMAAVWLLPSLLPLTMLKPQTGLPIILTNLTHKRVIACAIFGLLTFVVYPLWPLAWWRSASGYDGVIPLLVFPFGSLIALVLLNWRSREAWLIFLFACIPQRSIYDLVPLMVISHNRVEAIIVTAMSWVPIALLLLGYRESPQLSIFFIYLPLMAFNLFLLRKGEYKSNKQYQC